MYVYVCLTYSVYISICVLILYVYTEAIVNFILNGMKRFKTVLPKICHLLLCHFCDVDYFELKAMKALPVQETLLSLL